MCRPQHAGSFQSIPGIPGIEANQPPQPLLPFTSSYVAVYEAAGAGRRPLGRPHSGGAPGGNGAVRSAGGGSGAGAGVPRRALHQPLDWPQPERLPGAAAGPAGALKKKGVLDKEVTAAPCEFTSPPSARSPAGGGAVCCHYMPLLDTCTTKLALTAADYQERLRSTVGVLK
eukprot:1190560-Prorocentrum_minimum.AAC.3